MKLFNIYRNGDKIETFAGYDYLEHKEFCEMKLFSIGDTFTVNGIEWTGRGFVLDAAFEGWTLVAENAEGKTAQFTLREVEQIICNAS